MDQIIKYFSKKFISEESYTKAYIKFAKWSQKHIVHDPVLNETHMHLKHYQEDGLYIYRLDLYATLADDKSKESFCNACMEFHRRFYINQQFNCDRCNMKAREEDIKQRLLVKKEYRKEILRKKITKE